MSALSRLPRPRFAWLLAQLGAPCFALGISLALALGTSGCFGGPTSDLPGKTPSGSDNAGNNGGDSESNAGESDAGFGGNTGGSSGSPEDAGAEDSADAAAVPPSCPWSTPPADAASCGGSHCNLPRAELTAAPGSVCEPATTLDVVCSGDAQRVVHACWRNNMASLDRANAVASCAKADPLLMNLAPTCLDCYVALHECVSSACSFECALESSGDCEPCSHQKCVPAFTVCSGLLTP